MPKVAAFFYIKKKLIGKSTDLIFAEKSGDFLNCALSHYDIWEEYCKQSKQFACFDYDYFPRGRVVFNQLRNAFIVYLDPCINTHKNQKIILAEFDLAEQTVQFELDEHYQCKKCNKNYAE